jgi:hypothetical protein
VLLTLPLHDDACGAVRERAKHRPDLYMRPMTIEAALGAMRDLDRAVAVSGRCGGGRWQFVPGSGVRWGPRLRFYWC